MRRHIQPYEVANEMSMRRSKYRGAFLVVEGVTDSRLYGKFTNPSECQVVIAHSKDNVRKTVREMADTRGDGLTSGIVDQDYDLLLGKKFDEHLFVTDCHDLETALMRSSALDSVLWEYGDRDEMARFKQRTGDSVKDAIMKSSYPLGMLMFLSMKKDYNLSFRDINHRSFVDTAKISADNKRMVDHIFSLSGHSNANKRTVHQDLEVELKKNYDPWVICRGHDMVSILLLALRESIGLYNARSMNQGMLSGTLRLSYTREDFHSTELYAAIKEWGEDNGLHLWE